MLINISLGVIMLSVAVPATHYKGSLLSSLANFKLCHNKDSNKKYGLSEGRYKATRGVSCSWRNTQHNNT